MKVTTIQDAIKKEKSLFDAHNRAKNLIWHYLKDISNENGRTWETLHNWDFYLLYELQDRIESRIKENQSIYYALHWEKYQWNAYTV